MLIKQIFTYLFYFKKLNFLNSNPLPLNLKLQKL